MTRLEELRKRIQEANDAYWKKASPIISDQEYDHLVRDLKTLSPNDPLLSEIGSEEKIGREVVHKEPLLSLDKAYSYAEILTWAKKVARSKDEVFAVSCKYDGMCVELRGGVLSTRGDGVVGRDITALARHIGIITNIDWNTESERFDTNLYGLQGIIDHTEFEDDGSVVGELLVPIKRFNELKQTYPDIFAEYKTPRNLAAGFVNSRPGSAIYDLVSDKGPVWIAEIVSHKAYSIDVTLQQLIDEDVDLMKALRDFNGYPSDGICFFLKDQEYFKSLGATHHHPRGAIAWKFSDEQADTIVRSIDWQVGETHVTPVCNFDVVKLNGVLVKRATAHCAQWLKDRNICVGSHITIERRGGVIPKVVSVINDDPSARCIIPEVCPECETKLIQDGKFISCPNKSCAGKCVNRIIRGLECFGLKGIGPALASRVVHELIIDDIIEWCDQIGSRTEPVFELLRKKGFTNNEISIITQISDVMTSGATPETLLQSVCIQHCGIEFVTTIERECGGILGLLKLAAVDDMYNVIVGKCKSNAVTAFMIWMEENRERFEHYLSMFKILPGIHDGADCSGSKGIICFTGSGPEPRGALAKLAQSKGYLVTDNVNKCSILVAEDANGNSSKLQKARSRGTKIIDYTSFMAL